MLANIAIGSLPNWNVQVDNPELFNLFVNKAGQLNYTPGLDLKLSLPGVRAIWETPFEGGCYILVTDDEIWRVKENGSKKLLYGILDSAQTVDITENLQNQLTIVDGDKAYVIEQRNLDTVTVLSPTNGFTLGNPGSCCMINSFTVVLDVDSGYWQISDANNALQYSAIRINAIDSALFTPVAVRTINNNLFIFGSAGIERWEPTLNVNVYLFPLQKDMNFKINFGAISTASVVSNVNTIYFLSSRFIPMMINAQGFQSLLPPNEKEDESGIARELQAYPDVYSAQGAFYSFLGNFFYQITFAESQKTWVYCVNSKTFSNTDDFIIGAAFTTQYVITPAGFYELSTTPDSKKRYWIGEDIQVYKGQQNYRNVVNGVEARATQGSVQSQRPEYLSLAASIDRRTWSNDVRLAMGLVGQFNYRTIWRTNIACQYFKPRISYYGDYPLTIEAVDINVK